MANTCFLSKSSLASSQSNPQGKARGHSLATSPAMIRSQRQVTHRACQAASRPAFTRLRLGTSHLLVGALRAEPRCAEQRWVGVRGGQGEAPSLLLPGSHCPLGAAGSCGSSRPEAGHLSTLVPQTGSRGSFRADHCSLVNHQRLKDRKISKKFIHQHELGEHELGDLELGEQLWEIQGHCL